MIYNQNRIIHELVHPIAEDGEMCYMLLMFVEDGQIVQVVSVELRKNFLPFEGSTANIYYEYSSN